MTPERWQQAQDLFHQALDKPPEERAAFLHAACDDEALRAEIEALLAADSAPPSIFDTAREQTRTLHEEGSSSLTQDSPPTHVGRRIGPYRLMREIGRGGMGTVYLAQRTDLDNDVALKLVRGSLAAPETVARFLRERRVLARLEHPHIARLLDAGMTREQIPFFVMEYVEGEPITDYCDQRRLTISPRLSLFQTVCRAVHYAHQNLIIHRDLKPPNIFVTDDGQVKLLDFGIAKLVEEDDEAGLTRTGMRLMTPEYAAPEQVRGQAATTATDVYALGVLLYELMTGHRPYALRGCSLGEIERIICEEEPVRPSVAARRYADYMAGGGSGEAPSSEAVRVLRTRHSDRLHRRIKGDLDVICLKALSKEPSHRYASAEALWEDIARHLSGLPVKARASTVGYRVRKFVQRHRAGVLVTIAVELLSVLFIIRLAQERNRAQIETEKAQTVSGFMVELFRTSDPNAALGDAVTARQLLERGADRVQHDLVDQPAVRGEFLLSIGQAYLGLGLYDDALTTLEGALAAQHEAYGPEHPAVVRTMIEKGRILRVRGDLDEAADLLRQTLAIQRRLLASDDQALAETMDELAAALRLKDYSTEPEAFEEAQTLLEEALRIERNRPNKDLFREAAILENLAFLLREQERFAESEDMHRTVLTMRQNVYGASHPHVANSLINVAATLGDQQRYDEGEALFREGLAMRRATQGDDHPDVAIDVGGLAELLHEKGDLDAAITLYRDALPLLRQSFPEGSHRITKVIRLLSEALIEQGHAEEAESLLRELQMISQQ